MALINELIKIEDTPKIKTGVSADYCFNESIFQIRTYKNGDACRIEGQKQNIQLNIEMAKKLASKLQAFINQ